MHTYRQKTTISIKVKHNQNKTMYYKFQNYNKGETGHVQGCTAIKVGETKKLTLDLRRTGAAFYQRRATITLYYDSACKRMIMESQQLVGTYSLKNRC